MLEKRLHLWLMVLLLIGFVMTGCATKNEAPALPAFCAVALPIYIGKADVLTDQTARQILSHNLTGKALCQWSPKTRTPD